MIKKYPHEWKKYFDSRCIPQNVQDEYLSYIKNLHDQDIPIIFEIEHLALLLGMEISVLNRMIFGTKSFYRTFEIPKKSKDSVRIIDAPYPSLLSVQQWILKNILKNIHIDDSAHAYMKKKSILTNVTPHLNNKVLLKIDLKNFFPNIEKNRIIAVFLKLGYTQNISFALASLCTLNNHLPQGAPTSPTLSNIIAYRLDRRLSSLCKKSDMVYTRYADDMVITSKYISLKTKDLIITIIEDCGFIVNKDKTYLSTNQNKRIITGISIQDGTTKIPRKLKREIKQEMYYLNKYGFYSHINKRKITNPFYLERIRGQILFWNFIESDSTLAKEMLSDINRIIEIVENLSQ
ncbi:MAG: RNA-directed DNA polymerase [Sulfurovum sp.]|nr:RNA-directed DNA polymerase [Sulfurovum sp.]